MADDPSTPVIAAVISWTVRILAGSAVGALSVKASIWLVNDWTSDRNARAPMPTYGEAFRLTLGVVVVCTIMEFILGLIVPQMLPTDFPPPVQALLTTIIVGLLSLPVGTFLLAYWISDALPCKFWQGAVISMLSHGMMFLLGLAVGLVWGLGSREFGPPVR
jgi:hypothetical protein